MFLTAFSSMSVYQHSQNFPTWCGFSRNRRLAIQFPESALKM